MDIRKIGIVFCSIMFLSSLLTVLTEAQEQVGWSAPHQLSIENAKNWSNITVADQYGFVHAFWIEVGLANNHEIIQYARFDGETWSTPLDIYVGQQASLGNLSSVVDQRGILHLIWSGGMGQGPVYHIQAPAHNAASAQYWSRPRRLDIPADGVSLQVDSKNVLHILYSRYYEQPGLYYVRSKDEGITWSDPIWLDPDILPDYAPDALYVNLVLDEADGLHTVWYYLSFEGNGDWVRYAHSLDGGDSWSLPFTIDKLGEETGKQMNFAGPVLAVQGQTVHVIWAAGELNYHNHRYSTDAGQTWSVPVRVFGGLNGQAREYLTVDGIGRVHFLGQIRFPQAIWHAYWDKDHWSSPAIAYLIARSSGDPEEINRIHVHSVRSAIRNGNQLVMTFTDDPARQEPVVYAMHHTLADVSPSIPFPTPTLLPTVTPSPTPTPIPLAATPTLSRPKFTNTTTSAVASSNPSYPFWLGLLPVTLLLGSIIAYKLYRK